LNATNVFTAKQNLAASTVSAASANIASGIAPTTPLAGDIWNAGLSHRFRDNAGTPATHTIADLDSTQTLTNKTISSTNNTISIATTALTGTVTIAQGGTGAITKAAGFDALSPMSSAGDVVYGGASGTGTRLAVGTSSQVLHSGATPSWGAVALASEVSG